MRGRRVTATLVMTAVLILAAAPLSASDHRPPPARLIVGERGQTGKLLSYCWTSNTGPGGGAGRCVDTVWDFPDRALRVQPTREAKIRIKHPAEIQRASLRGWRRVRDTGYGEEPVGNGRRFRVRIDSNRSGGEINGWTLFFHLPEREGPLYLDLFVRWRFRGDASYTFHLDLEK